MCPNDWEWGGLSWSINFDCLPDDYSSANNAAARLCVYTATNMIHGGFPLRATVWFSCCRTLTWDRYLQGWRGGGGGGEWGGFTQISLAFYLSFKSFQAWWDSSAVGVRQTRLQTHGGGGPSPPGDLFVYCGPNNLWCCLPCYNVLQCLLAPYLIKLELLDVPLSLQPHWLRLARTLQSDCHPLSRTPVTWRQENVAASLQRWRVCLGLVSICLCI